MRKIMTFILFASLANNIACSSGFEKAVPKNLQDLAIPLDTTSAPKPGDESDKNGENKDAGKTTRITPTVKDGDNLDKTKRPVMTVPGPDPKATPTGIKEQAEVRKMDQAMEVVTVARITPAAPTAEQAPNTNTNVPVVEAIAPATKVAEQADVRKYENEMASQVPLEWAFSELRIILPDTLLATQDSEKEVVIANNALMHNKTAMFRLAGEKSYMLCRAAATPGLAKGDTFTFVSATQTEWSKDKRATVALLTFENKSTQKGLKFSCLIFGSKTENDFKANMKDVIEFRNHMGLYN